MTTQIRIVLDQNPHDKAVVVRRGDQTLALLRNEGDSHVAPVWDGSDLGVTEIPRPKDPA